MNKREKVDKIIQVAFLVVVMISLLYILLTDRAYKEDYFSFDDKSILEWNDSWEIHYDGNICQDISLPVEVPVKKGNTVILRKRLPDKIKKYNCIMLEGMRQDVIVSIGGIQRAIYSNTGKRPWGKTTPQGVVLVPLYNTDSLADVAIHISSDSFFSGKIGTIRLGNEKSLMVMLLKSNMICIFLIVITFIMGIICAICFYAYAFNFEISKALHYLAYFAVFSAIWSFSQSGLRQLFVENLTLLEAIGYCCYMLIPIPLILYVNWILECRYKFVTKCYLCIVMANFILENLVQAIFKVGFFEMRIATQIIMSGGMLLIILLCLLEGKKGFEARIRFLLIGTVGLFLGLLTELSFHNITMPGELYNKYIIGAFAFLTSGFFYTVRCISKEQQRRKDAESANRAKSMFLASMSHEIRTPINTILGMNEMVMRDSGEDNIREYAANISKAGKSLLSLVNDILDFSKIETGKMEIVCAEYQMKPILRDLVSMTESRIRNKELKLILNIDATIPSTYYGDEGRIKQVITNLLTNAAKYTQKGEIVFTVKNLGMQDDVINLYFSVKDTGMGIREEDIDRFMDSFSRIEQVKNSNIEGTGLGLPITTKLLNLMDSKLEVNSVFGQGSDFHFELKQKVVDKTEMGAVRVQTESGERKSKIDFIAPDAKILAVDDNRMNLMVLKGLLKTTKIQVKTCESGKACLELCKEHYYDLIFMDHMMPEMDGIETFKKLRSDTEANCSHSPVIAHTANTVTGADEMYKKIGFDYYLKKPIDVAELNEVLKKYIPKDMILPLEEE